MARPPLLLAVLLIRAARKLTSELGSDKDFICGRPCRPIASTGEHAIRTRGRARLARAATLTTDGSGYIESAPSSCDHAESGSRRHQRAAVPLRSDHAAPLGRQRRCAADWLVCQR